MSAMTSTTCFSGLVEYLQGKAGVKEVEVKPGRPAGQSEITSWEKRYDCVLPEDVKMFYLTHNGINLHWSCLHHDSTVTVGRIHIASLSELHPLTTSQSNSSDTPSLLDLEIETGDRGWQPSLCSSDKCLVMLLDHCSTCGHTCLVLSREPSSPTSTDRGEQGGVWLLDLGLSWHRLSCSFSDYLRLATVHLGLRQWPYALTTNRLSPQYQYWFNIFAPHRLELDLSHLSSATYPHHQGPVSRESKTIDVDVSKILQIKPSREKSVSGRVKSASSRHPTGQGASTRGVPPATKN